jgi:ATP-dependent Clp protease ATP-binding subunit ClpX
MDNVAKVVIDEGVITGTSEPILIYENQEPAKASADS